MIPIRVPILSYAYMPVYRCRIEGSEENEGDSASLRSLNLGLQLQELPGSKG